MPGSTDDEENVEEGWRQGEDIDDDDHSNGLLGQEQAEDYDPEADDADEAFINRARGNRRSDALLSCPGCLTTVCIDCQAHAYKDGQYRAMFSINTRSACYFSPSVSLTRCRSSVTVTAALELRKVGLSMS